MISSSYESDAKKFISDLRKIKNAPRYAVGFEHTIKAIEYAVDVVSGRIERSKLIIQSLENSLNDILYRQTEEKYLWKFDPVKAEKTCFFIETLRHVKGKWGSQKAHIILEPWQCDIICNLFGWVDKETENRRYTESYCEVPRKNGKTVIAAGIGLYMFLADGESGAEVNCGAKTKTQAEEVFNPARLMLLQNPALLAKYQPDIKVESIKLADGGTFKTIVGVPIDGGSPHCAILDEIHQHNNGDLYESQQTGLGSREQPLIFMITTAGYDLLSFCKEKHDENVSNIMGSVPDERLFSRIYSIDPEDLDLIGNPDESAEVEERDLRILKKANPNFGVSLNTSYLRMQCLKSFKSNSDRAKFLTKHLNVWVNNAAAYFSMDALKYCADDKLNIENFIGCPCVISVDLNSKLDLGCICIVFAKNIEGLLHYYAFPEFFLPETTVNDCSQPNFKIYQKFAHMPAHNTCCGFVLNVSDGYETDYMNMTETISNLATVYHPSEIIFDSYNALQMEQEIERNYGLNVLEFSKTTAYFSPAMKEMSSAIMAQRFHFDGNECLSWNIGNVESKKDLNDNDFPRKANLRQQNKIDGAICCMMAIARLMIIGCEGSSDEHYRNIYEDY